MTSGRCTQNYEQLLCALVSEGLSRAENGVLLQVAEGLWFESWVPDLSQLPEDLRPDAGYVLDRLARFNVVEKEQKQRVISAIGSYKPNFSELLVRHKDKLANEWGASEELTLRLPELMPYQTRQYRKDRLSAK